MKKSELTEIIREVIKETIRKVDGKYVVYPEKGGKRLGTHSTKKAAEKQLTAIHINKEAVDTDNMLTVLSVVDGKRNLANDQISQLFSDDVGGTFYIYTNEEGEYENLKPISKQDAYKYIDYYNARLKKDHKREEKLGAELGVLGIESELQFNKGEFKTDPSVFSLNEGPGKDYLDKAARAYFQAKDFEDAKPKPNPNDVAAYIGEAETDEIDEHILRDFIKKGNYKEVQVAEYQFDENKYDFSKAAGAGEHDSSIIIFKVVDKSGKHILIPGDSGKKSYPYLSTTDRGILGDTYPLLEAEHVKILKSIADIFQPTDVYENYADGKVKDQLRKYIDDYTEIDIDLLKKLLQDKEKYPKELDPRTGGNKFGYRGMTFKKDFINKLKEIKTSNGVTEYEVPSNVKINSRSTKGFLSFTVDEEVAKGFGHYSGYVDHKKSSDRVGGYVRVSLNNPNFILHPDYTGELSKDLEYSKESEKETLFIGTSFTPDRIYVVDKDIYKENYADGKVKEAFSPSPLQNLVNDYLFFITMNFAHLEKTGKSPQDVDALTQMIRQAKVDVDKLKDLSKDQLEKNKNSILQRIHDMLTYIISRMKAHMRPEEYEKRRDRLNKLLALYKDAAKVQENYADSEVKGKSRPGRVKKAGASCKGSVTDLRAKAKKYGGEKGKMYHWCANMKGGKK